MLEIRHFKLIKMVVEEGSLTKASEKLFLSQSALSHQLKEIENYIGKKVFERSGKKLILTEVGDLLMKSAERILSEIDSINSQLEIISDKEVGKIQIATQHYTAYHWLPAILKAIEEPFKSAEILINSLGDEKPLDALLNEKLDIVIAHEINKSNSIECVTLFRDDLIAIVAKNHHWAKLKSIKPIQFSAEVLISHYSKSKSKDSYFYREVIKPNKAKPKLIISAPLTETYVELIKSGLGVTVMAQWVAADYLKRNELVAIPIESDKISLDWYIAYKKSNQNIKFIIYFIELIRLYFKNKLINVHSN